MALTETQKRWRIYRWPALRPSGKSQYPPTVYMFSRWLQGMCGWTEEQAEEFAWAIAQQHGQEPDKEKSARPALRVVQ